MSGVASRAAAWDNTRNLGHLLKIAPYIAWNNVGGELALFDSRDGAYHALNDTGAAIWRGIASGLDAAAIVRMLASDRDALPAEIERDVGDFLDQARAKGLLEDRD
jgi:hypothetical protein